MLVTLPFFGLIFQPSTSYQPVVLNLLEVLNKNEGNVVICLGMNCGFLRQPTMQTKELSSGWRCHTQQPLARLDYVGLHRIKMLLAGPRI